MSAKKDQQASMNAPREARPGYKHTKLGWIPEEWEVTRYGEMTTLLTNGFVGTATTHYTDAADGVPYVQGYNVKEFTIDYHGMCKVNRTFHEKNAKSCLREGDLLTVQTGDIGVTSIVPDDLAGANCHALVISRFKQDAAFAGYYLQYLNSPIGRAMIRRIETGSTMKHINVGDLKREWVIQPTGPEQRRIAAVLGAWDRAIATVQQLLAAQQERKRGLMQELLTGKRRFPGFGGKWKAVPFDKVFTPKKEVAGEGDYQVLSVTTNGLVLQADYFNRDVASTDRSNYLVVRKGDFVFSGLNFWMGSVDMVWDFDEGIISPAYKCFTINEDQMLLDFARHFIRSHVMLMALVKCSIQGASIVRRNLDKELLEAWPFKLPSIPEQRKIADALNAMTDTIQALEQELDHLTTQKRGLMQQLLTGAVRVKH